MPHIMPGAAKAAALRTREHEGPVARLNRLRVRARADHRNAPHRAPGSPVTGRDACARDAATIAPLRATSGGQGLFSGRVGAWFLGPDDEHRDHARLARQAGFARFLAFEHDPAAREPGAHRTAARADSRPLPLAEDQAEKT